MSDTPRTDATFARIQSGSESPVIDWMGFACHLELDLSAANEAIVDCHRAYDELWDELLQLREERDRLREAFDAACAFIDSHVADPDITSEMWSNYEKFLQHRQALASVPTEASIAADIMRTVGEGPDEGPEDLAWPV